MMTKRREFILKSLIGSAGFALGGISLKSRTIASLTDSTETVSKGRNLHPVAEAEEEVYRYLPADNGAGPMWCGGSTSIVRIGKKVFASGLETMPEWKPLNNCRWLLFERSEKGWIQKLADKEGRTREPSPVAAFHDGRFFLSANPTLTGPDDRDGPAQPEILLFNKPDDQMRFEQLLPVWAGNPPFTEHSYRSLAADGASGELILFQNIGYTHAEWSFLNAGGKWSAQGKLEWPWGAGYEVPEPVRVCYPNVMLKDRAVYFCGVSDIIEPKKVWRDYKREITGKEWDYDFRRLFFTWSDDITSGKFHPWIEIASREETCGWIFPADLWVAPDGAVHLLWTERALDERLREKFFPEAKQSHALNYAIVRKGKVEVRRTLALAGEGGSNEIPSAARFQIAPGNRLLVVYFVKGSNAAGQPVVENRLLELTSDGFPGTPVTLPLKHPFSSFFTATVRAGSKPSSTLDMLGTLDGVKNAIHYAKVRLW
jgi:hypothetical protein